MADLITPILEQVETILQTNFNTEIDLIDAALPNVDNDSIVIEDFDLTMQRFPWTQIFLRGGENEIESDLQNTNVIIKPTIITAITIVGSSSTQLIKDLSKYLSSMLNTIVKGTGTDNYDLDGVVDLIRPVGWGHEDFINQETSELAKGGFLVWDTELELDPAT